MNAGDNGELPEGWTWTRLGELGRWGGGGTPTTGKSEYWENGTIPWVSAKDMKTEYLGDAMDRITDQGREAARLTLLPVGSLLMVVRGMILARAFPVAVTTAPLTINQDLRSLIPAPLVEPPFLLRALQRIAPDVFHATGEATHGTRRLESDTLKAWPIPLPPLAEQGRIVAAVEAMLAKVNAARDRLNRVPAILKRFRQAVLSAACSGRLTIDWREKNPATMLPEAERTKRPLEVELPATWCWKKSSELFGFVTSGSRGWAKHYSESGAMFLRVGNLNHDTVDLDLRSVQRVTPPDTAEGTRTKVQQGDILISITAEPGMVGLVESDLGEAFVNQHVALARPNEGMNRRYLATYIAAPNGGQWQFEEMHCGATKLGLGLDDIRNLWIACPPLAEQREIVRQVGKLFALADTIEARLSDARRMADQLTQAVLAKAFRGELVPTEAELARRETRPYEPAADLLARIRAEREKAVTANGKPTRPRKPRRAADLGDA